MAKSMCFVISPIGEKDSEIRQNADDLLELVIKPALEIFPELSVLRGDHRSEANQIDVDVIKCVQESELCIADVSEPNINVYYEIGRRDETGKPLILVKRKDSGTLPVDIATRRYIEYDLDSRYGVRDAVAQIRNFVEPLAEQGFQGNNAGASLSEIAATLARVERKLDRFEKTGAGNSSIAAPAAEVAGAEGLEPSQEFRLGLMKNNVPMMDHAMSKLQYTMDKISFIDQIVERAAPKGSDVAGTYLIENIQEFMDSPKTSFSQKIEALGALISYAARKNKEGDILEMCEQSFFPMLLSKRDTEAPKSICRVYNQRNRLYYGMFSNTEDEKYLKMAISSLHDALEYSKEPYIFFNLATCERYINIEDAKTHIDTCLEMEKEKPDVDHLVLALKIYYKMKNPAYEDIYEQIKSINPGRADYELAMLKR